MDAIVAVCNATNAGNLNRLQSYVLTLEANPQVQARLFVTNAEIGPTTTLGTLTEATYSGYNPIAVTNFDGPYVDESGSPYADTGSLIFTCNGGGVSNTVWSLGLTVSTGAAATATGAETGGVVDDITVTDGGSGYESVPRVVITDATIGAGATAHAVLADGVVTSIVIDDGGADYTGPIVTIDRPARLIGGVKFDQGRRMSFNTDAIIAIAEINGD